MTVKDFWALTEDIGWGTKTTNYNQVRKYLRQHCNEAEIRRMNNIRADLVHALYEPCFNKVTLGDDSYDDLLNHIVGLGKAEYKAVLADPELAAARANKDDFEESFSYCFHGEE